MESGDIIKLTRRISDLPKGTYLKLVNLMSGSPNEKWSARILNSINIITNLRGEDFQILDFDRKATNMDFELELKIADLQRAGYAVRITYHPEPNLKINRLDLGKPVAMQPVTIEIEPNGQSFGNMTVGVFGQGLEETFAKAISQLEGK